MERKPNPTRTKIENILDSIYFVLFFVVVLPAVILLMIMKVAGRVRSPFVSSKTDTHKVSGSLR